MMMIRSEGGTGDVPGEPPSPVYHLSTQADHDPTRIALALLKLSLVSLEPTTSTDKCHIVKILLTTVLSSIIEVVILCTAGYILARAGILDKPTQRKLNVVNGMFLGIVVFGRPEIEI